MKATLTNYHQAPRKVRLIADLIRGKTVPQAQASLLFLDKKSVPAIKKLLDSAISNARNSGAPVDNLFIKNISVDKGAVLMRTRPFSRGRAGKIRKTMSIVKIELAAADKATKNNVRKTKSPATGHKLQANL